MYIILIKLSSGRVINFSSVVSFEQNKDGELELMLPTGEIISTDKYNLSTFMDEIDPIYLITSGINYICF